MNDDINKKTRNDSWSNFLSGLGTTADKGRATRNRQSIIITDNELEAIYSDDGLGARIVDLLPEDMLKQGWKYEFKNEKEDMETISKAYNSIFENTKLHEKISEAIKWARLYGGSILIIGAYDGQDLSEPLNPKKIKSFENFKVVPRLNIEYGLMEFQNDSSKPRFGEVEYYPVNFKIGQTLQMARVHYSRVIEFHGIKIPNSGLSSIPMEYRYWGLPVLQRVRDRLGDLGVSFGSISNLMQELTVGKYKLSGLAEILAEDDGTKLMQNRIQAMDLMKSCFHSVYMDSEDDFVRDTLSLGGVSDVLYQFMMIVSASTGYPMTKLFGISPGGLNSTGDSDTYNYYDMVRAKQQLELIPVLNKIISIVSEWKKLELPEIILNPLEQMTEKEQAELEEKKANTEKTKAETYQAYIDMGIMEPEVVEVLEFGNTLKDITNELDILPPVQEINNPPAKKTKEEQDELIPEISNKNNKTAKQNNKK